MLQKLCIYWERNISMVVFGWLISFGFAEENTFKDKNIRNTCKGDEGRTTRRNICLQKELSVGKTRYRSRRRKNMSGIPGIWQHWQAVLKYRIIMIPLPKNMAAGVAFGVCCSVKGCCRISGSRPDGPTYSGLHRGRENEKL